MITWRDFSVAGESSCKFGRSFDLKDVSRKDWRSQLRVFSSNNRFQRSDSHVIHSRIHWVRRLRKKFVGSWVRESTCMSFQTLTYGTLYEALDLRSRRVTGTKVVQMHKVYNNFCSLASAKDSLGLKLKLSCISSATTERGIGANPWQSDEEREFEWANSTVLVQRYIQRIQQVLPFIHRQDVHRMRHSTPEPLIEKLHVFSFHLPLHGVKLLYLLFFTSRYRVEQSLIPWHWSLKEEGDSDKEVMISKDSLVVKSMISLRLKMLR